MFISQNQLVSERESLSRVRVMVAGKPANDHDVLQFQTCTLLRYGLEADLRGLSGIEACVYRRVIHGIPSVDLYGYASDMKYVKLAYLTRLQQTQGEFPWLPFKREVAAHIQNKWILVVVANLVQSPMACLQWLAFDERMLLTTNEKDIASEIADYVSFEEELAAREWAPPSVYERRLASILREWFCDFSFADQVPDPTFGPGAISDWAGRSSQLEKSCCISHDCGTVHELTQYWDCTPEELMISTSCGSHTGCVELWQNKIIFRPKNALKHRIISAEPGWLTWLQQAIKRPIYDYVESHPKMNTWFSDQGFSRDLALRGSIDGSYATIDFSNASDAISATLVARLFGEVPWVRDPLLLTRSHRALLPDGQIIHLNKFAPMGSATCFATLDVIMLSMCELATRTAFGRMGTRSDYVVYGDDVILRAEAVPAFLSISQSLGFRPNMDKSYAQTDTPGFYRESCGIEAYNGVDITPLRYSRFQEPLLARAPVDINYWESAISLMNRCLVDYHYENVRSVVWACVTHSCSKGPLSKRQLANSIRDNVLRIDCSDYEKGYDGPLAVVVPDGTATNYHCTRKYDKSYQRMSIRVRCFETEMNDPTKELRTSYNGTIPESIANLASWRLWEFKAETDRPSAADQGRTKEKWYNRYSESDDIPEDRVSAVAGVRSQKWGWTRYYP